MYFNVLMYGIVRHGIYFYVWVYVWLGDKLYILTLGRMDVCAYMYM